MVALRFERVLALPNQAIANTIYFVKPADAETALQYVTGNDGVPVLVGGATATPTPTPKPAFTAGPVIVGTPEVGQTLTGMSTVTNGEVVTRRWFLGGVLMATAFFYEADASGSLVIEDTATGPGGTTVATSDAKIITEAGAPLSADYSQAFGATGDDGMVIQFPLRPDNVSRQMFVDPDLGSDSYNGLSPTPGQRPNGNGTYLQYGATDTVAQTSGENWGPKKTYIAAENALPNRSWQANEAGVGHHILLKRGRLYIDPPASEHGGNRFSRHYGFTAPVFFPFVVQTYDERDPWNHARHGKHVGSDRAEMRLSTDNKWNFTSDVDSGNGLVGSFAIRSLRFTDSNGSRTAPSVSVGFPQTDGDNFLIENCDMGPASVAIVNTSADKGKARFSHNLVVRKTLFDGCYTLDGRTPALYSAYVLGVVVEDCVFNHAAWKKTEQGRYLAADQGGPTVYRHAIYISGPGQELNKIRRNIGIDDAATFLSNRNNSEASNNVVIDAPIGLISAGFVGNSEGWVAEQPNRNYWDHHHNLVMGSDLLSAGGLRINAQPTPGQSFLRVGNVEFEYVNVGQPPTTGRNPITLGSDVAGTRANVLAVLNARAEPLIARANWVLYNNAIQQRPKKHGTPLVWVEAYGPGLELDVSLARGWGYAAANGVPEAVMRDSLLINSGLYGNTGNAPNALGLVVDNGVEEGFAAAFTGIKQYAYGTNNENAAARPGVAIRYADNSYSATSPYSNDEIYAALGFADKDAFVAAVVANHELQWALIIQDKVAELFSFNFTAARIEPPSASPLPASTQTPRVGDTVTFPDPTTDGEIVSATTYANLHPLPSTGKADNTLTLTSAHFGKKLCRQCVIRPVGGGPTTTTLVEIDTPVAAGSGSPGPTVTKLTVLKRMTETGDATNGYSYAGNGATNLGSATVGAAVTEIALAGDGYVQMRLASDFDPTYGGAYSGQTAILSLGSKASADEAAGQAPGGVAGIFYSSGYGWAVLTGYYDTTLATAPNAPVGPGSYARLRRAGTTVYAETSLDAAAWTIAHTWTGVSGTRYAAVSVGNDLANSRATAIKTLGFA